MGLERTLPIVPWDKYFLNIAAVVATRSSCSRRQVGAVIAKDNHLLATGYNGTPSGIKNCNEGGCPRCAGNAPSGTSLNECICSHAEENAIVQAARHGVTIEGGTIYCTISPCIHCAKMIINAGLKKVFFSNWYNEPVVSLDPVPEGFATLEDPIIYKYRLKYEADVATNLLLMAHVQVHHFDEILEKNGVQVWEN